MDFKVTAPVLLIFFNRPDTFKEVFDKVREVRPQKLYLAQDGPRSGNDDDTIRIQECRRITSMIDWDCVVYQNYSDVNLGCGVRPQSAISWVLEKEENVIILEDDCIPNTSFFRYCDELLEEYKNDERVCLISGLNHFDTWNTKTDREADYFFCKTGAIWGWATWARAWKKYDYYLEKYSHDAFDAISEQIGNRNVARKRVKVWNETFRKLRKGENITYWDYQWGIVRYAQSQYTIVPKKNMITNIGIGDHSTHARGTNLAKFKKFENFVFIPTHDISFPLVHPNLMICDYAYDKLVYRINYPSRLKIYYTIIKNKLRN